MNIIDVLKFIVIYYNSNEIIDNANEEVKEAIEDLTDAAKFLLEKYGEDWTTLEDFNLHNTNI